jgi:hypothetical protein
LHSLFIARNYAVKITQIFPKKVTKAERVKKLYFENKYLFGSKIKEKKLKPEDDLPQPAISNDNDKSGEIYWTCLHVPEVQDFTKKSPKKKTSGKKKDSASKKEKTTKKIKDDAKSAGDIAGINEPLEKEEKSGAEEIILPKKRGPKPKPKQTLKEKTTKVIVKIPELPETLKILQNNLPEVRAEIKQSLENSFRMKPIQFVKSVGDREIPFESYQLKEITNFPYSMSFDQKLNVFDRFIPEQSTIYLPSVSKVLQGTMPEAQRQALIQWKTIKISELGLEGFEKMQECKLIYYNSTLEYFSLIISHLQPIFREESNFTSACKITSRAIQSMNLISIPKCAPFGEA